MTRAIDELVDKADAAPRSDVLGRDPAHHERLVQHRLQLRLEFLDFGRFALELLSRLSSSVLLSVRESVTSSVGAQG